MKKVLIISHSGGLGGAEYVYLQMIKKLTADGYLIKAAIPNSGNLLNAKLSEIGVEAFRFDIDLSIPDLSGYLLRYHFSDRIGIRQLEDFIEKNEIEVVISSTIATLDGVIAANRKSIPHIFYCHELIEKSPEIWNSGIDYSYYMRLIFEMTDGVIAGSEYVKSKLDNFDLSSKMKSLNPLHWGLPHLERKKQNLDESQKNRIVFIGTLSKRKNPIFVLQILKSLTTAGHDFEAVFVGTNGDDRLNLINSIARWSLEDRVSVIDFCEDPYDYLTANSIFISSSREEPYGIVIPEVLLRGVPVLATPHGAANDLLSNYYHIDLNKPVEICRKVLEIFDSYENHASAAKESIGLGLKNIDKYDFDEKIKYFLELKKEGVLSNIFKNDDYKSWIIPNGIWPKQVEWVISSCLKINSEEFNDFVNSEKSIPGSIINSEMKLFGALPFFESEGLNKFYKDGKSFIFELYAYAYDVARLMMISYVIMYLESRMMKKNIMKEFECLAVGDGLGLDAIRLAEYGLSVDYYEYEKSLMSEIGNSLINNYKAFSKSNPKIKTVSSFPNEKQYDFAICFEVLEHVADLDSFLKFLNSRIKIGGLLFLSECCDGIRDRWPSHLFETEKLKDKIIPLFMVYGFELVHSNRYPYNKPYVFKRRAVDDLSWNKAMALSESI